jgi:hypothetical protein
MLTANDAANPGIFHEPCNPFLTAGNARFMKFIPRSMAAISSSTHNMTRRDRLHERRIARLTL